MHGYEAPGGLICVRLITLCDDAVLLRKVMMTRRHARQTATGAVFSDPSGRRRKRMQRIGYAVGGGCVVYMGLLGVSLTGGPIGPELLLPPGVPDKIERLLNPESAQAHRDDPSPVGNEQPSQPLAVPGYDSGPRIPGRSPQPAPSGQVGSDAPATATPAPVPGGGDAPVPANPPAPEPSAPAPVDPPAAPEPPAVPESPAPVEPVDPPEVPVPSAPENPTGSVEVPAPDLSPDVGDVPDLLPSVPGTPG